ncbi:MAG: hypothetical protein NXI27_29910 [Alphaproteobacteria bacterium]|nr:hypothetical protein [Alphaproteobacteria bacterium]
MTDKITTIAILLIFAVGMMFYGLSNPQFTVEAPAADAVLQ